MTERSGETKKGDIIRGSGRCQRRWLLLALSLGGRTRRGRRSGYESKGGKGSVVQSKPDGTRDETTRTKANGARQHQKDGWLCI
jgi:hypothetical protein